MTTRRDFLKGVGAAAGMSVAPPGEAPPRTTEKLTTAITARVNGQALEAEVENRWTLLELLRDQLGLTGTKLGCDRGECGACTVLLNGTPVYSCSQLAAWIDGQEVTTIEGLLQGGELHPIQQAFVAFDGYQCGFCTPAQVLTAKALLDQDPDPPVEDIQRAMAGTLCRCASYNRIVEAVQKAAKAPGRPPGQGGGHE